MGTDLCGPCGRCQGVDAVFARHYSKFNASVMAVGGDQVAHLMWRMQNGEAPVKNKVGGWVGGWAGGRVGGWAGGRVGGWAGGRLWWGC